VIITMTCTTEIMTIMTQQKSILQPHVLYGLRSHKLQPTKLTPKTSITRRAAKRTTESQTMARGHRRGARNLMLVKTTAGTSAPTRSRKRRPPVHKTFKIQNSTPKQSKQLIASQAKIRDKNPILKVQRRILSQRRSH